MRLGRPRRGERGKLRTVTVVVPNREVVGANLIIVLLQGGLRAANTKARRMRAKHLRRGVGDLVLAAARGVPVVHAPQARPQVLAPRRRHGGGDESRGVEDGLSYYTGLRRAHGSGGGRHGHRHGHLKSCERNHRPRSGCKLGCDQKRTAPTAYQELSSRNTLRRDHHRASWRARYRASHQARASPSPNRTHEQHQNDDTHFLVLV